MNVGELLQKVGQAKVFTIPPTASVRNAAMEMRAHKVAALLVYNDDERMTGIVTERDLVQKVIAAGHNPDTTRVGQVMTPAGQVVTISRDTDIRTAVEIMRKHHFRHAPVVRSGDIPDGILSIRDLLEAL